jgi:long-chain acyl-CoA synthetase
MTPTTLNDLFFAAVSRHANQSHTLARRGPDGQWHRIDHATLRTRVHHVHAALRHAGLVAGDRVAILSENRPEWAITDYACLTARCADVPVYPTLPAKQIEYILRDAGARAIFVSNATQLAKVLEIRDELPEIRLVVVFEDVELPEGVLSFAAFEATGAAAAATYPDWEHEAGTVTADDLATLIYTSGTTGHPKGVMLTHGNITSNVVASLQVLDLRAGDSCLSFLPLSHIFERMVGHYTMLYAGASINYATAFDTVVKEMGEIQPTVMASVPRLYEKIFAAVTEKALNAGGSKRAIFEWARATAEKRLDYALNGRAVPPGIRLASALADRLVFRKLRGIMGGNLRFCVSGGAPLNPDICRFFIGAGLPCLEGYGLTETSPVITVNRMASIKPGTVGHPIPGVEVRIAGDGEILCRGPNVMRGYWNNPVATAEVLDPDGWFHTGDIGVIDADGCLRITDRKKDLIVTAGGKNIAPQPIEALLKTNKFFSNAVMIGDKRRFPAMLLVPNFPALQHWAKVKGLPELPPEELAAHPDAIDKLEREARKELRDLAQFETPKKFLVIPRDFTIDRGELTPKLSVRRRNVEENYRTQVEALYVED